MPWAWWKLPYRLTPSLHVTWEIRWLLQCCAVVWLAQTSLPEAIRTELLNLPVAPGHVFHPETKVVLDRTERAAASSIYLVYVLEQG